MLALTFSCQDNRKVEQVKRKGRKQEAEVDTSLCCVSLSRVSKERWLLGCREDWETLGKPPKSFQKKVLGQCQAQHSSVLEILGEELL